MVKVLIVESHDLVRYALESRLRSAAGVEIVGSVGEYESALDHARAIRPDVILMETKAPGGLETLKALCATLPTCPVIVLTSYPDSLEEDEARQGGARRYLLKTLNTLELVREILDIAQLAEPPTPAAWPDAALQPSDKKAPKA